MKRILSLLAILSLTAAPSTAKAGSHWLTGGLIGAGVGVGSGLGIVYGACTLTEEGTTNCRKVSMPIGAIIMGGVGFGLGALIGSAFKKKQPIAKIFLDPKTGTYGASIDVPF